VGRQVWRGAAASAGAADPEHEAVALFAQYGERGPVEALRREHVGVVDAGDLLRGERLGRALHEVAGVVDHDVEATVLVHDGLDAASTDSCEEESISTTRRSTSCSAAYFAVSSARPAL